MRVPQRDVVTAFDQTLVIGDFVAVSAYAEMSPSCFPFAE
jgi:hypothetical protein